MNYQATLFQKVTMNDSIPFSYNIYLQLYSILELDYIYSIMFWCIYSFENNLKCFEED